MSDSKKRRIDNGDASPAEGQDPLPSSEVISRFISSMSLSQALSFIATVGSKHRGVYDELQTLVTENPDMIKLFVRSLSYSTTEEALTEHFSQFGSIADMHLPRDPATKRAKGFAFITFSSMASAHKALETSPQIIDGREIHVHLASEKNGRNKKSAFASSQTPGVQGMVGIPMGGGAANHDDTKVFVRDLSYDTTSESLRKAFEVFGPVKECNVLQNKETGKSRRFGFVNFVQPMHARAAVAQPVKQIDGRATMCNFASDRKRQQQAAAGGAVQQSNMTPQGRGMLPPMPGGGPMMNNGAAAANGGGGMPMMHHRASPAAAVAASAAIPAALSNVSPGIGGIGGGGGVLASAGIGIRPRGVGVGGPPMPSIGGGGQTPMNAMPAAMPISMNMAAPTGVGQLAAAPPRRPGGIMPFMSGGGNSGMSGGGGSQMMPPLPVAGALGNNSAAALGGGGSMTPMLAGGGNTGGMNPATGMPFGGAMNSTGMSFGGGMNAMNPSMPGGGNTMNSSMPGVRMGGGALAATGIGLGGGNSGGSGMNQFPQQQQQPPQQQPKQQFNSNTGYTTTTNWR